MRRLRIGTCVALAVLVVGTGAAASPGHGPTLHVIVRGPGHVTCDHVCAGAHPRGSILSLTGTPAANYEFGHWNDACIGVASSCPVALDRDTSVRATFVGQPTDVAVVVGGPGGLTSDPPGLDCGNTGYRCELTVPFDTEFTLIPTAGANGRFAGWDGPCAASGSNVCTLRIDSFGTEIAAAFGHSTPLPGDQPLTVTPNGAHVTSQPPGIDCPLICAASFPSGTIVTLYRDFGQWAGGCVGALDLDRCAIAVDTPTDVVIAPPPPPPAPRPPAGWIRITVGGPGLIESSNGRLLCGRSVQVHMQCGGLFGAGNVRLTTRARAGAHLARWGGACLHAPSVCKLHLQDQQTLQVTALFRSRSLSR